MNEAKNPARERELDKTTALYNAATDYAAYVNSEKHDFDEGMKLSDALEAAAVSYAEIAGDRQPTMSKTPEPSTLASNEMKIYTASKTRHAKYWQQLRAQGVNIISTWIDEAGPGQTKDPAELAQRCLTEIVKCDALLLYITDTDEPIGAFFEAGAALAIGKPVMVVAPLYKIGIFKYHPLVTHFMCVADALDLEPSNDKLSDREL